MKKTVGSFERWVGNHFPGLYLNLIQQPRNYFRFRNERVLASGLKLSESKQNSILFFTTQKCASRFVDQVITRLASVEGMVHADYDAYVTMTRIPKGSGVFASQQNMRRAFHPIGYYYGPIGTYRDIPDMDQFRTVLQLRDPRDVLTSLYFSTAFSHAVISPKLVKRRREALGMDIDTFVLQNSEEYLNIFSRYIDILLKKKFVLFLRYEEMVSDFANWLGKLSAHLGLNQNKEILESIWKESDFSVKNEDVYSHRRQIAPGDYLRKLSPDTIYRINSRFDLVLKQLDYTY